MYERRIPVRGRRKSGRYNTVERKVRGRDRETLCKMKRRREGSSRKKKEMRRRNKEVICYWWDGVPPMPSIVATKQNPTLTLK